MKYAALIFGDDKRHQPKRAADKSSPEPGQIVRSVDGSAFRVASKIAGPDGVVVKLANLQGKPVQTPQNFRPVGIAVARLASWLKHHLAYNRDFDLYINSYIERYNQQHKNQPLPYPVGRDGKAFRWANWFQSVVSPKLFVAGRGTPEDKQAIKDELIHEMLFTVLGHRNVLDQFVTKAKKLGVNRQNGATKLTDFLISTFMYRIDEMQNKLREQMPEEEVSMWQPGHSEESDEEVNILEQEEFGVGEAEFQSAEARKDVGRFREAFRKWLLKPNVAGQKGGENFTLMFDIFWRLLQETDGSDAIKRNELEHEWMERTGLSFGSFKDYFTRLPDMVENFITTHGTELGDTNIFIDLMNTIREERDERERKQQRRQKERARPAMVSSLHTAGVEGDFAEAISNSENPDVVDPDIAQPTETVEEAGKQAGVEDDSIRKEQLLNSIRPGDRVTILVPAGMGRNGQEWTERSGRAVIVSPGHVALNMGGQHGTPGVATVENIVSVRKAKRSSTGMECQFIEYKPGVWYYLLEDYGSPKGAWDWRENATAYGPFASWEAGNEHLRSNHANPGGSSRITNDQLRPDKVLDNAIAHAQNPNKKSLWGSAKIAQKLIRGGDLTSEQIKQVQNAFIYRWTTENKRRGEVYHCDKCDVQNNPYVNESSAEGHHHPTIPLQSDAQWMGEHAFAFTNAGKLLPRGHAVPAYLAPEQTNPVLASVAQKFAMEKAAYNPGMGQYIFQADVYCEHCGDMLKHKLDAQGEAPEDMSDEYSFDSDVYPKGPFYEQESDGPEHCANCGKFLENPLTTEGYKYLNQMIAEHEEGGQGNDEVIEEWKEFYPEREQFAVTGSSKEAMIGHMFENADGQAIRDETLPNGRLPDVYDATETSQRRMGASSELWACLDCGAEGELDTNGGGCSTCGSQAVHAVQPQTLPETIRETNPVEVEKRMVRHRAPKPLPLSSSKKADGAGSTTVTMQNQNATIPATPGKGQPMAVPDAIDQTSGPHSPNAPATAPRTPAIQPRIVNVPAGTADGDMASTASVDDPEDISCPECGGGNIDLDVLGDEGYQIYCEDCEKTTFEGRLVSGSPVRDYREMPGDEFEHLDMDAVEPPEEAPFDGHEAAGDTGDNAKAPEGVELDPHTLPQPNQTDEVPDNYWEVWSQEQKEAWLVAHNWVKDDSWHGAAWWMGKPMWTKKDYEESIPYTATDDAINEELELQHEESEGNEKQGAGSNSGQDDARGVGDLYRENFYEHRTKGLTTDGLLSGMKEGAAPVAIAPAPVVSPNVQQNMNLVRPQPAPMGPGGTEVAISPSGAPGDEPSIGKHTVEPELPNSKYHMMGALILAEEQRLAKEAFDEDI